MFNYNERISFEEFEQPRDTVNLDVSQRQEQASPSVQELKASGRHDDQDEDKQENDGHSP